MKKTDVLGKQKNFLKNFFIDFSLFFNKNTPWKKI